MNINLKINDNNYDNIYYILIILNCEKYKYKSQFQKETWLNNENIYPIQMYFHIIGNNNLETNYLFDFENNILYLKVEDDYNSLPKKVITAFQVILEKFKNIKYIFKTDDDQNLINNNIFNVLLKVLENNKSKYHYGGKIIDVNKPYLSQYFRIHKELPNYLPIYPTKYCNGRFYFLSFEAINYLIQKNVKENIEKEFLEDYAIGYNLDIKFKKNILNIENEKYFNDFNF